MQERVFRQFDSAAANLLIVGFRFVRCGWRIPALRDLRVHPFDPFRAPSGSLEWICKVLCFPCNLVAFELHDAHGV